MRRISVLFLFILCVFGCTTYKFSQGIKPYEQGYVALRNGRPIPEYTLGKDNSVPQDLNLAKERFQRRRIAVEHYYKETGDIEGPLAALWNYPAMFVEFTVGQLRLPFVAISDYKYKHDPKYKEKVDRLEQERLAEETNRSNKLKDELASFIQKDLASEELLTTVAKAQEVEVSAQPREEKPQLRVEEPQETKVEPAEAPVEKKVEQAVEKPPSGQEAKRKNAIVKALKKAPAKEKPKTKVKPKPEERRSVKGEPKAIIIARPTNGYSPLQVHFYGSKSYSRAARIIAYSWDFGDGDTSTKANPVNTYYSMSFQPQTFTVTLTVHDNKGNSNTATATIEVRNR